jgi:hypothetical protein
MLAAQALSAAAAAAVAVCMQLQWRLGLCAGRMLLQLVEPQQ